MGTVRLFIQEGGKLKIVDNRATYEGGIVKGMRVDKEIKYDEFIRLVSRVLNIDLAKFSVSLKCIYLLRGGEVHYDIKDDEDLSFYLDGNDVIEWPLSIISVAKNFSGSASGSNRVLETVENVNNEVRLGDDDESMLHAVDDLQCDYPTVGLNTLLDETGDDIEELDLPTHEEPRPTHEEPAPMHEQPPPMHQRRRMNRTEFNYVSQEPEGENVEPRNLEKYSGTQQTISLIGESSSTDEIEEGQIFLSKKEISMKLCLMAMKKSFEFRVKKSGKHIYCVACIDYNCNWRMRAVLVKGTGVWKVSRFVNVHSCSFEVLNHDHRQAKSWVVGELIKSKYEGVSRQYRPRDIIQDMRQQYGINISYEKAWRARENAYVTVRGSPEESYNMLSRYGEVLKIKNPGSLYFMNCDSEHHFKYFFMALGPSIRGFLNSIRPVIAVDGTFLKGKYRGTLLVSAALDGNDQIYPIAFGIVDRETDESWKWFLEKLKVAIGEVNDLVFISDRNSSIAKSVSLVFPTAFHGICIYHLSQNLKAKFKNEDILPTFYTLVKVYRESEFQELWDRLVAFNPGLSQYLEEAGKERWSRAFSQSRRYDIMTTNIAECLNGVLKDARELPVVGLLEHIRSMIQRWFFERRTTASKWTTFLTFWADHQLNEKNDTSLRMHVIPIDVYQFLVRDGGKDGIVNLNTRECSCRQFQLDQMPCPHALAAVRERNIAATTLCSPYYTTESCLAAYAEPIHPVGHESEWTVSPEYIHEDVLPPKVVKRIGRRKKERITSIGETREVRKCGRCGGMGHNRQTCKNPIALRN